MRRERFFSHLPLAAKISLLVGLMGLVSMAIIGYAMVSMRQMDTQYRTLIALESELTHSFGDASVLLALGLISSPLALWVLRGLERGEVVIVRGWLRRLRRTA